MNTYEYHKHVIQCGIEALKKTRHIVGEQLFTKRSSEFIRTKMSEEIVSTLSYQQEKKDAIEQRRFKDIPAWISTVQQKQILRQIGNNPEIKKRISLHSDHIAFITSSGIKKLSNTIVDTVKAQEIMQNVPGLELGKNIIFSDISGKMHAYFTIDAIQKIAAHGTYRIPSRADRNEMGSILLGTKRIDNRSTLAGLMQYATPGILISHHREKRKHYSRADGHYRIRNYFDDLTSVRSFPSNPKTNNYILCLNPHTTNDNVIRHLDSADHAHSLVLMLNMHT